MSHFFLKVRAFRHQTIAFSYGQMTTKFPSGHLPCGSILHTEVRHDLDTGHMRSLEAPALHVALPKSRIRHLYR